MTDVAAALADENLVEKLIRLDAALRQTGVPHLVACKAVFNRAKDWLDIANVLRDTSDLDVAEARRWIGAIADEGVLARFDELAARQASAHRTGRSDE